METIASIPSGVWLSAALGAGIAITLVLASAVMGYRALRRSPEAYLHASVRGSIWRMAGALVGTGLGLALGPTSTPVFVVTFLAVYLAGHLVLALRLGAALASRSGGDSSRSATDRAAQTF